MTIRETIFQLKALPLVNKTHKIGGQQIGPLGPMNVLQTILGCFVSMGELPKGFVFSAPAGYTRALAEMLRLSRSGKHEEAMKMFRLSVKQLFDAWEIVRDELEPLVPKERQVEYSQEVKLIEIRIFQEKIRNFVTQMEAIFRPDSDVVPNLAKAFVFSVGEQSFGEIVVRPLCEILTKFFGVNFAYLDPLQEIVAVEDEGYTELMPNVGQSVERLKQVISFRRSRHGESITFVVPGFYMAKNFGSPIIATMPFNGSDISAYILSLALESDLIYVKRDIRPLPEGGIVSLIEAQERELLTDGKKSELVATSVLRWLVESQRGLRLFDPEKGQHYYLPAGEKVGV